MNLLLSSMFINTLFQWWMLIINMATVLNTEVSVSLSKKKAKPLCFRQCSSPFQSQSFGCKYRSHSHLLLLPVRGCQSEESLKMALKTEELSWQMMASITTKVILTWESCKNNNTEIEISIIVSVHIFSPYS